MAEIGQGLVLMGVGMSIVYLFLILLIFVTRHLCAWIGRFDSILPQDAPRKAAPKAASSNTDADVALAIAVALG